MQTTNCPALSAIGCACGYTFGECKKVFDRLNSSDNMTELHSVMSWNFGKRKKSQPANREVTLTRGSMDIELTLLELVLLLVGAAAVISVLGKIIHGCWAVSYRRKIKAHGKEIVKRESLCDDCDDE